MIKYPGIITVCASKYFDSNEIRKIHQKGFFHFGENKAQDLLRKKKELSDLEITWHFIGHLQTNKVKDIINEIDYLHTLDRPKLLDFIQTYRNQPISCFIQVNLTEEPQKSGIYPDKLNEFLLEIKKYDKINIVGLMTMGKDHDIEATDKAFKMLDELATLYHLPFRSMGMSDDDLIAIKHHTTHLRIGRKFKEFLD
jgi:pyridoxal phosphate enzyme (YggS family)